MKIHTNLPFDHLEAPTEFITPDAVREISGCLETVGFYGANVTDHPVPGSRWLDAGGHHAQDPFVMLSFVAAATTTLRLQTGILVLPYRNPFITARAAASLDVFSGGRLSLGVGAGYLKAEYRALGVDFEQRNELFDEYLRALHTAWRQDEFSFKGSGYEAPGNRILPRPHQEPNPPLLIGGNARRAIRRAVEYGDAWFPFLTGPAMNATSRTSAVATLDDLREGIRYMNEQCEKVGRVQLPSLAIGSPVFPGETLDSAALVDRILELEDMGFEQCSVNIRGASRAQWCADAERVATEVLSKL